MAATDPPNDLPAPPEDPAAERYAALDLSHGETVIYDRDNPRAWLQSTDAIAVTEMS